MTTIITRLYSDEASAQAVVATLIENGIPEGCLQIIAGDSGDAAVAKMRGARVSPASAAVYAGAMKPGYALLVAQIGFNPRGAARTAIETVNASASVKVALAEQEGYIREYPSVEISRSTLAGNPLLMSNPFARPSHGHILGSNPISKSKPRTSAIRGGAYMSKMFWPMKLVSQKTSNSAVRGGFLVSEMFGLPTLIRSWPSREQLYRPSGICAG